MTGYDIPKIKTNVPGPKSKRLARMLRRYECPNVTFISKDMPIFWEKALGCNVWDVDQNRYIDLVAAFGVTPAGHAHPKIIRALLKQAAQLPHAMGDVYPAEGKVKLAQTLSKLFPEPGAQVFFGCSGSEAVEIAMKTVHLATGKGGLIVFEGAYHGLTYGALRATSMLNFEKPFVQQKAQNIFRVPFPVSFPKEISEEKILSQIKHILGRQRVGGILIEPIQGRGGIRICPPAFLKALRKMCDDHNILLIVDEIYSGFGRTGKYFAFEHSAIIPDLITVGKGLAGGFPISACIGRKEVMAAWPRPYGEALHTSTFLGNPMGCAMALASIQEIQNGKLVQRAKIFGKKFMDALMPLKEKYAIVGDIRGKGLMIGIELVKSKKVLTPHPQAAQTLVIQALKKGIILLADGIYQNVLTLTPALTLSEKQMFCAIQVIDRCLNELKN